MWLGIEHANVTTLSSAAIQTIYFHFYSIVLDARQEEWDNRTRIKIVKVPSFELHSSPSCHHNYFNFFSGPIARSDYHMRLMYDCLLVLFYVRVCALERPLKTHSIDCSFIWTLLFFVYLF